MRNQFHKRVLLASGIILGVVMISPIVHAADWTGTDGGSGSWGIFNTAAPIPGWNDPVGFPNAQGAVAQLIGPVTTSSPITVQDTGAPVTVGKINYGNNNDLGDFYWQITNTNGITLDQDGAGSGFATISNSSTTAGGNNALYITTGTLTLADNLHITNTTTGSTNNNGAIQIDTALAGTGNITLNSSQSIDSLMSNTRAQGSIRFTQAGTAYTGTVAIERGLVVVAATNAFGTVATNTITLGSAGANDATLVSQGITAFPTPIIPNDIVLAAGNTGALTVGTLNTNASGVTAFNGTITLNGNNLNIINTAAAGAMNFNGQITGTGGITKIGPGIISFNPTKPAAGTNDYTGDTIVNEGNLSLFTGGSFGLNAIPDGPGKGNVIVNAGAILAVSGTETINGLSGSGFLQNTTNTGAHTFNIGANDVTSTFSGVMRNTQTNRVLSISKTGTGTLTLTGANIYSGTTTINGGTSQFAKQASLYNNQVNATNGNANGTTQPLTGTWTAANIRVNAGATAAFNVGGTDEFTEANIATLQALGAAATNSGFGDGSSIGLDTTNAAGGEFIYNNPITNTFAGANSIGLKKLGANTLTLTATSTYTGNTTVSAGTLNITGNHTTGANYSIASGASLITKNVRASNSLTVNGTATINANGGTAGASKVETLTIGAGGKLNLKDNDLVVGTAANVTAVRAAIKTGVAGAAGITSDLPAFGVTTGFGYALGNDSAISPLLAGSLAGQTYDADSVLVKYTFLGDADLDGDSDLNDLGLWAQSFTGDLGNPVTPATFWTSGDFDYDGDTDLNDLGFWAGTFTGDLGGGAGSLIVVAPGAPAGAVAALNSIGITVVPEPSTFVLAGVGLAGLVISARRRNRRA